MSVGREISSLMKWLVIMLTLNGGLVLIVFFQMAKVNQCNEHLQKTFLYPGVFLVTAGSIGLSFSVIASLVPRIIVLWRRYGQ
jgi:hypothetical protein